MIRSRAYTRDSSAVFVLPSRTVAGKTHAEETRKLQEGIRKRINALGAKIRTP